MDKIILKNSKEILINNLENINENEQNFIDNYFNAKIEKRLDHIYLLSSFKENKIDKLKTKISLIEEKKKNYLNNLEYQLNNLEISASEYENQQKKFRLKNFNGWDDQILRLEKKISSKEIKWNNLIENKRKKFKKIINKYDDLKNNRLQDLVLKKQNFISYLEENSGKIKESDLKEFEHNEKKIINSSTFKKYESLEKDLQNKNIGPLEYEELKKKYTFKHNELVNLINSNKNTKSSKKYMFQMNSKYLFSFSKQNAVMKRGINLYNSSKLLIIILILSIIIGIIEPVFFSTRNWQNILTQNADLGCMAIGVGIIILTGGIDLSVGSTLAFGTAIGAQLLLKGVNLYVVFIAIIGFCVSSGIIAGIFVSVFKIQPFIVTLTLMLIWRGVTQVYLHNSVISIQNETLNNLFKTEFLSISLSVWVMIILLLVAFLILRFTVYGRALYATGGNYKAAQLSGIKVKTVITSAYAFAGVCMGIGTILFMARTRTASPSVGNAWELDAIACVVLGGTLLTGGKGGVILTLMGWFTLSVLKNALVMVGLDTNVQQIFKGLIILIAILSNNNYGISRKLKSKIIEVFYSLRTI